MKIYLDRGVEVALCDIHAGGRHQDRVLIRCGSRTSQAPCADCANPHPDWPEPESEYRTRRSPQ